jgi:hypothetical protein
VRKQRKIYENTTLSGSQILIVEIIGEKFPHKSYPEPSAFSERALNER